MKNDGGVENLRKIYMFLLLPVVFLLSHFTPRSLIIIATIFLVNDHRGVGRGKGSKDGRGELPPNFDIQQLNSLCLNSTSKVIV